MQFALLQSLHALDIASAITLAAGTVLYAFVTRNGYSDPNPYTWLSLAFIGMAAGHWTLVVAAILTLAYAAFGNMLSTARATADWVALCFCIAVWVASFLTPDYVDPASIGALVFAGTGAALYPTLAEAFKRPYSEQPLAWFVFALAFAMSSASGYLHRGDFLSTGFPFAAMLLSLCVAGLAMRDHWSRARLL